MTSRKSLEREKIEQGNAQNVFQGPKEELFVFICICLCKVCDFFNVGFL